MTQTFFDFFLIYPNHVLSWSNQDWKWSHSWIFIEVKTFPKEGCNSSDMDENPCKMKLTVLTETSKCAAVQTQVGITVKSTPPNLSVNLVLLFLNSKCWDGFVPSLLGESLTSPRGIFNVTISWCITCSSVNVNISTYVHDHKPAIGRLRLFHLWPFHKKGRQKVNHFSHPEAAVLC